MEALGKDIKNEYVLHVVGKVIERSSKNPNIANWGNIEIGKLLKLILSIRLK